MAFREAIAAEALYLAVATLRKLLLVTARNHAIDHFRLELVDRADIAKGRHRAAQAIGIGG